jgi:hypothetical protein
LQSAIDFSAFFGSFLTGSPDFVSGKSDHDNVKENFVEELDAFFQSKLVIEWFECELALNLQKSSIDG